ESVVAEKDVSDAGNQNHSNALHFIEGVEKTVTRLALKSEVFSRVVLNHHRNMCAIFKILFDGFDNRCAAGEHDVENVASCLWPQPDPIAFLNAASNVAQGSVQFHELIRRQ